VKEQKSGNAGTEKDGWCREEWELPLCLSKNLPFVHDVTSSQIGRMKTNRDGAEEPTGHNMKKVHWHTSLLAGLDCDSAWHKMLRTALFKKEALLNQTPRWSS